MALDSNLYTLSLQRRVHDPAILDLVPIRPEASQLCAINTAAPSSSAPRASPSSTKPVVSASKLVDPAVQPPSDPLYTYSRAQTPAYNVQLIDATTQLPLAGIACPASTDRAKALQLLNPDESIAFEKKGNTFRQEWKFEFAQNDFIVRRDGRAYLVVANRKPDPEIDIVRYTPPYAKHKPGILQVLDYNVSRLDVSDRRGLEIVAILSVCHCLDQDYDEKHKGPENIYTHGEAPTVAAIGAATSPGIAQTNGASDEVRTEPNEILISLHTPIGTYVEHALGMLRCDGGQGMHMIMLRAMSADTTTIAVRTAAEIKAKWYKLAPVAKGRTLDPPRGSTNDVAEELYQYVRDPSPPASQAPAKSAPVATSTISDGLGPRGRIKLDAPKKESSGDGRPGSAATGSKLSALFGGGSAQHKTPSPSSPDPSLAAPGVTRGASPARPPAQLVIYLSKDRIDEFERETRTLADAMSAARIAAEQEAAGSRLRPSASPSALAPPRPPPKQHKPPSPQPASHPQANHGASASRLLGKLGLRSRGEAA